MLQIGDWVLRNACVQAADWRAVGLPPCRLSVNVSGPQLGHGELLPTIQQTLRESGWSSSLLDLELSENRISYDDVTVLSNLAALRGFGIRLAMDDFGTGSSSLALLRRFPIDVVKIDRTFVANAASDRADAAIVKGTIEIAHGLGLEVVAEGVETEEQVALLRGFGCDYAQGFHFGRPMPAVEAAAFLYDESRRGLRAP